MNSFHMYKGVYSALFIELAGADHSLAILQSCGVHAFYYNVSCWMITESISFLQTDSEGYSREKVQQIC